MEWRKDHYGMLGIEEGPDIHVTEEKLDFPPNCLQLSAESNDRPWSSRGSVSSWPQQRPLVREATVVEIAMELLLCRVGLLLHLLALPAHWSLLTYIAFWLNHTYIFYDNPPHTQIKPEGIMILLHFSDSTKCLKAHFDCDDFSCPVIPVPVIICLCPQTSRQKKCSRYNPLDFSHGRFCDTSGNSKRSLIL